jgi:hypothetical protein
MKPQVELLRNIAAQVCSSRRFPFRAFMSDHGLEGVLEDADAADWSTKELACQVLVRCCTEDGRFNNFQIGFLAVMTFLNVSLGRL